MSARPPRDRLWAAGLKVGDTLVPKPLWNQTERRSRRLADRVAIEGIVRTRGCQTSVMVRVTTVAGVVLWLDAGWFAQPGSHGYLAVGDPPAARSA